jgi:RimJ/RimL family protein N-acetyltransferase
MDTGESLSVRLARPEDRNAILTLATGDEDYVPRVLDTWFAEGWLFVGDLAGSVVALTHLVGLSPNVGWLEGARVRPDLRGRGIASTMLGWIKRYSADLGMNTLRMAVGTDNVASMRHVEKCGFRKVARFAQLEFGTLYTIDVAVRSSEPPADREILRLYHGMYSRGFRWEELNDDVLWTYSQSGAFLQVNGSRLLVTDQNKKGPVKSVQVGYAEPSQDFLGSALSYFYTRLYDRVRITLPPELGSCCPSGYLKKTEFFVYQFTPGVDGF